MKNLILLAFLIVCAGNAFAELEVDIPFDTDIVGLPFTVPYTHETEWITITNIGNTTETYTLEYTDANVPSGWYLSVCNHESCLLANWPAAVPLAPGEFEEIHISIQVNSTDAFDFEMILDSGDLTEPMNLPFSFRTEDYAVSSDVDLPTPERFLTNYPNPFNPSTTILYELTTQELAETSITIFNSRGQLVRTYDNLDESGRLVWNGKDKNGNEVKSGVYLYRLSTKGNSQIKKMILIK